MKIENVSKTLKDGVVTLDADITRSRKSLPDFKLYYKFSGVTEDEIDGSADPFAVACLIKAMRSNDPLIISQPISRRLHIMLPRVRDIYNNWWPETFSKIKIETTPRIEQISPPKDAIGTLFSGGVDSFYSLLKHREIGEQIGRPLTHLVFMRGVETRLSKTKGVEGSEEWVKQVASALGVRAIFGETNIRSHVRIHWEKYAHGSALASVALCLSPMLGFMCIPSAFSYKHLVAHGSTALVDEMFSSDNMYIFHDGSEASRAEKVEAIVNWEKDISLKYLRVCIENSGGAFNCGKCRKCVRTAIPLEIMGLLDSNDIFRAKGTEHWKNFIMADHYELLKENLEFSKKRKADPQLVAVLESAVRHRRFDQAMAEMKDLAITEIEE